VDRALLVVSARLPAAANVTPGPRKDYTALATALNADVIDYASVERSLVGRLAARLAGMPIAQALLAFLASGRYDAILTDGEHIGIPLALLLKLRRSNVAHVTIGHRLSTPKKRPFFRWLGAHSHIARIAVHSSLQRELAIRELGVPEAKIALVPYQVDPDFWQPRSGIEEERLVASAGLEHRDYPTLFRAVDGLDARIVIGAASHWSRQPNTADGEDIPANVEVGSFDYHALREIYARAAVVVVPLYDVDFQAGVTTILEAMAMGKAVVVTHTQGQSDVVEDRRAATRGLVPRIRPVSLLRAIAREAGEDVNPNGFYVPAGEPDALRRALVYLLDHPAERRELGAAGRRAIERFLTLDQFAARMAALVDQGRAARRLASYARRPATYVRLGRARSAEAKS
jgi:glycosyltransferase involved in cell wall biosynthesis